ncbi:MAG: amidohydrolase family protein [Sulfolobaceae archaeon]
MPGLVNAHTHLYSFSIAKYYKDIYNDFEIFNSSDEMIEMVILEMLSNGITTFIDMGTDPNIIKKLAEIYKIRAYAGYFINQNNIITESEFFKQIVNSYLPTDADLLSSLNINKPLHIKLPFTRKQIYEFKRKYGVMPIEFLNKNNLLNKNIYISNLSWITNWEIEILKQKRPLTIITPSFDLKNAIGGFPPIREILEGTNNTLAIGTDGIFGNEANNLIEEGKLALLFYRSLYWDLDLSYTDIFKMLTYNAYKALGINAGVLREGYVADLIVINKFINFSTNNVNMVIRNLFTYFNIKDIEIVIVNGNLSYIRERDYEKIREKREKLSYW